MRSWKSLGMVSILYYGGFREKRAANWEAVIGRGGKSFVFCLFPFSVFKFYS